MNKRLSRKKIIASLLCLYFPQQALSQTPSELAGLSLQELMGLSIHDDDSISTQDNNRWNMSYGYQRLTLDGYRTKTENLSDQTALFRPPEARTAKNYPVVPTTITQEVHTVNLNYRWNNDLQVGITAPYIRQSTDHLSSVPGFDEFTLTSDGIGDVSLNLGYQLPTQGSGNWKVSAAISLPTGSIKETGDTPRNGSGTKEQLPYTMQIGSGTYDFPLSLQYADSYDSFQYGAQATALIRTGKNSEGYRLGNSYGINSWVRWMTKT